MGLEPAAWRTQVGAGPWLWVGHGVARVAVPGEVWSIQLVVAGMQLVELPGCP